MIQRVLHLTGGLRAINTEEDMSLIRIVPSISTQPFTLILEEYDKLGNAVREVGLKYLGVDFYEHHIQRQGLYPPDWQPYYSGKGETWKARLCEEVWGNLANAAFEKNDLYFVELARKIQFQLTSCYWELRTLSEAYHKEISVHCQTSEFKEGLRFETQNSFFTYRSVHAFFSNIGTLRDYLAEYIASYPLKDKISSSTKITKMSTLLKALKKDEEHLIVKEIFNITDEKQGWLAELSAYRDLVVHCAPISYASHRAYIYQVSQTANNIKLPSIKFPLPRKPLELMQKRSKGSLHDNVQAWIDMSADFKLSDTDKDALEYCHEALGRMVYLSASLAGFAPYQPKPLVLKPI